MSSPNDAIISNHSQLDLTSFLKITWVFVNTLIFLKPWGQFSKTFTSVAIILEYENNSYNCKLHV